MGVNINKKNSKKDGSFAKQLNCLLILLTGFSILLGCSQSDDKSIIDKIFLQERKEVTKINPDPIEPETKKAVEAQQKREKIRKNLNSLKEKDRSKIKKLLPIVIREQIEEGKTEEARYNLLRLEYFGQEEKEYLLLKKELENSSE